ncbi:MAG: hypothetical protein RL385_1436 [Pseudomonadota bacterium]|jgi:amidase
MPTHPQIHAFRDDALGTHDAVELARLIAKGELGEDEVRSAVQARAALVDPRLRAIEVARFDAPQRDAGARDAPFAGVPIFIKDTLDVAGFPTGYGSAAVERRPATRNGALTRDFLAEGFSIVGKSRLPEFGFSPTGEYEDGEPTRNPWNPEYSSGASSSGAAALVASGVVPIAHGNDGGGSIRIPAACCGLVGLKATRGRIADGEALSFMPVRIVTEGVLTRTVRDSAHFLAAAERVRPRRGLPPTGLVEGPGKKRLRIAVVTDSIGGLKSCDETRAVVLRTAQRLEALGHRIEPLTPPVPQFFMEDFKLYWGFIAFAIRRFGFTQIRGFHPDRLDGLTRGLVRYCEQRMHRLPLAMARLQGSSLVYKREFRRFDAVLSPVVSHVAPKLGYFSPLIPFDTLFERIIAYTAFTPLNNAAGAPGISVPAGRSATGVPIGVNFSAAHGAERLLLELAYELEQDAAGAARSEF